MEDQTENRQDHFAHCVQIFGGVTAFSRRMGIDELALRRFANGEKPVSDGLMADTAAALRDLIEQAQAALAQIERGV